MKGLQSPKRSVQKTQVYKDKTERQRQHSEEAKEHIEEGIWRVNWKKLTREKEN